MRFSLKCGSDDSGLIHFNAGQWGDTEACFSKGVIVFGFRLRSLPGTAWLTQYKTTQTRPKLPTGFLAGFRHMDTAEILSLYSAQRGLMV